jgi:methionyl-tRNA formyltransferase
MAEKRAARAVVFGYGDVGARCLGVLLDSGIEVPLVVTHRDDPAEKLWYASVAELARGKGLPFLESPSNEEIEREVRQIAPDFIFSFYYRSMLPMSVLRLAKRGAFNMHGSLLPKYRGRAPLNWAIVHGESETGATLHEMVEKPDAGRIVDQQAIPIGPDETAVEVFRKLTDAAVSVLEKNIHSLVKGQIKLKANDLSKGGDFGRRTPEDGRIDWSRPAREIHNLVRAVAPPFPGAFCDFRGKKMKIFRTSLEDRKAPGGQQGPYQQDGKWFAGCGDGKVLRLLEIEQQ